MDFSINATAEKLEVPVYALKCLVNHSVSSDMTGRYLFWILTEFGFTCVE